MSDPSYFRIKGEDADLPLLLWPDEEGEVIIQVGRKRPWTSYGDRPAFASFVTDTMWMTSPITRAEYTAAMDVGLWPDGKSSKETA